MTDIENADLTIDEAWVLVGKACYDYRDRLARYALMLVRANVAEKTELLNKITERSEK